MSFAQAWDETNPSDSRTAALGASDIRGFKSAIRERLSVDHEFKSDESGDDNIGYHNACTLIDQLPYGPPLDYAGGGRLYGYSVTVTGVKIAELFYKDSASNIMQLTSQGKINSALFGFLANILPGAGIIPAVNLQSVYPVGCIYTTVDVTNPATVFGFGTWNVFGIGRCLVGVDGAHTEFNTVEKTGGEMTHQLTIPEMPSHTHSFSAPRDDNSASSIDQSGGRWQRSQTTGSTGGDGAHNNLQPFITVYFFKRVA